MTSNDISLSELINEDVLSQEKLEFEISNIGKREEISVYFNENKIIYEVKPQFINDKLMLPIRHTLETMGFEVEWSNNEMSAKIINIGTDTKTFINENAYLKEESIFSLSDAPIIVNGRTLIPIEFFYETLGLDFEIKDGKVIFFKEEGITPLNSYKGYLIKATKEKEAIIYYLGDEREGEVVKKVKVENNNSFYQKIPIIGNYINIIGSLQGDEYVGTIIY